jgi:RNA polymerase sigma-70 factor, ECF subfamily
MMSLRDASDAELVERVCSGDREGMNELINRYQRALAGYALRLVGNTHDAADVCQEVWHRVFLGRRNSPTIRNYEVNRSEFFGWLCNQARSCASEFLRGKRRHNPLPLRAGEDLAGDQDAAGRLETREYLQHYVSRLPPDLREVIELRYFKRLSLAEIAARLGTAISTIWNREDDAKRLLRELLGDPPL